MPNVKRISRYLLQIIVIVVILGFFWGGGGGKGGLALHKIDNAEAVGRTKERFFSPFRL